MALYAWLASFTLSAAAPVSPPPTTAQLAEDLGAQAFPLERPCRDSGCSQKVLDTFFRKLERIERTKKGKARILHLGDSHIAGDYITRAIRAQLQARFGNGGRGFIAIDQRHEYGGRRLQRRHWSRTRAVDPDGPGKPFGFSGMALEAQRPGGEIAFALEPSDEEVVAYYHARPQGAGMRLETDHGRVGRILGKSHLPESLSERLTLRPHRRGAPPTRLSVRAEAAGAVLFGLSFESKERGIIYEAVGPVGADARTYTQMEPKSFEAHLGRLSPDIVVLMVGGNDARAVRDGQRTMGEVKSDAQALVRRVQQALPQAECLVWAPLDAGARAHGEIVSKAFVEETRDVLHAVAMEHGCAFWDTFAAMGGKGSFGRWLKAGIMNKDMVHPRAAGGDLLGQLFFDALMKSYEDSNITELGQRSP